MTGSRQAVELPPPAVYSIPQAAAVLGMDPSTLYGWIRSGDCPLRVLTISRRLKIARVELDRYLAGDRAGSPFVPGAAPPAADPDRDPAAVGVPTAPAAARVDHHAGAPPAA